MTDRDDYFNCKSLDYIKDRDIIGKNPCGPIYGAAPEEIEHFDPKWTEFMHYCYLPVKFPDSLDDRMDVRLPERLRFLRSLVCDIIGREMWTGYVYVTARRGYAAPTDPLNRPGWHTDGFGTTDINYIWTDRWPTQFFLGTYGGISDDHIRSAEQFAYGASYMPNRITTYPAKQVLRLDSTMIHSTPEIPEPGGMRSFFKISLSGQKYNLVGNSHNYLFEYDWDMHDRDTLRNDPAFAGKDSGPQ